MKKIILLASVLAMVVSGANADYRKVRTGNCNSAAMHAKLEREVRAHRAVITEVVCEETRVVAEPVMVYEPVYVPAVPGIVSQFHAEIEIQLGRALEDAVYGHLGEDGGTFFKQRPKRVTDGLGSVF